MGWERIERGLGRAFTARPRHFGDSFVVERRRPFRLARLANEVLGESEHDFESWPGSFMRLLDEAGVARRELLSFYWDGFGPMSSVAGLEVIGNGRRRYLCYWDEDESYRAAAALEPWDDPLALSGTVARLLRKNGTGFGLGLFGSLPTKTTNYASELLPASLVRQSYFDLLQWWERRGWSAWIGLAEEHYGRMVEPDHLQRCLDILKTLPPLVDSEASGRWLAEREAESAALPDEARQKLFDEWFAVSYEEAAERVHGGN